MERDLESLRPLLADRYRIDGELGRGGYAVVYRAWNLRLERAEALKVLSPKRGDDDDFAPRFMQEVRLAAGLEHPSIVKVYDFGESGGAIWYSMQLVDGQSLAVRLRRSGVLSAPEAARLAVPLLDALAYSHGRGIVHRDIKPENVLLDGDGRPYLTDFGIAKSAGSLVKTQTGFLMGTPAYVSPEQAQAKPLDGRTDLYALGITLYRIVSGRFPFEAPDPLGAVVLRLTQPPRPLADVLPAADPGFTAIVMRALERDPSSRWESARAMGDAFADYLEGKPAASGRLRSPQAAAASGSPAAAMPADAPSEATRLGPDSQVDVPAAASTPEPPPARPWRRPRRLGVLGLAGAVVGLIVLLGVVTLLVGPRRDRETDPSGTASSPRSTPSSPALAVPTPAVAEPRLSEALDARATPTAVPAAESASAARPRRQAPAKPLPEPPPIRRPVTTPEGLDPEPPFAGPPPAGCSGARVTVGFAVDETGRITAPRLFPSEAPPECGRFVLDALPEWKWRPATDAAGAPVPSARLVVEIQLP
ncbi:MAG: protein kinase domain-containing protein [Thermoanaerobaculia bacterium]